jgi:hypothetical protein
MYLRIIITEIAGLEKMVKNPIELKTSGRPYREPANVNDLIGDVVEQLQQSHAMQGMTEKRLGIISRMEEGHVEIQISDTGRCCRALDLTLEPHATRRRES